MSNKPADRPPPEQPRSEPEILAPGDPRGEPNARSPFGDADADNSAVFITVDEHGRTHYRKITPPGPFTMGVVLTLIGLAGAAILLFALGFILFLIPVAVVTIGALALSGHLKKWWGQLERK